MHLFSGTGNNEGQGVHQFKSTLPSTMICIYDAPDKLPHLIHWASAGHPFARLGSVGSVELHVLYLWFFVVFLRNSGTRDVLSDGSFYLRLSWFLGRQIQLRGRVVLLVKHCFLLRIVERKLGVGFSSVHVGNAPNLSWAPVERVLRVGRAQQAHRGGSGVSIGISIPTPQVILIALRLLCTMANPNFLEIRPFAYQNRLNSSSHSFVQLPFACQHTSA